MTTLTAILLGALGVLIGYIGIRTGVSVNKEFKKSQKAEQKAAESRQSVAEKVSEVHKQKENDLATVSKDGKERAKKANDKIKDFNSKI